MFAAVRAIVPNHFLLVPGIGAQGGDFEKTVDAGFNEVCGLLINSSRGIIYASNNIDDFKAKAAEAAFEMQQQMKLALQKKGY
jgi:orotidine-5'-phosphate decarboxylase